MTTKMYGCSGICKLKETILDKPCRENNYKIYNKTVIMKKKINYNLNNQIFNFITLMNKTNKLRITMIIKMISSKVRDSPNI